MPGPQHRCPSCDRLVDVASLAFSAAAEDFICPDCLLSAAAAAPAGGGKRFSLLRRGRWRSLPWVVTGFIALGLCVTALMIAFVSRLHRDDTAAWEDANRERIVALKSEAEALVIAQQLPEAHAKYR